MMIGTCTIPIGKLAPCEGLVLLYHLYVVQEHTDIILVSTTHMWICLTCSIRLSHSLRAADNPSLAG